MGREQPWDLYRAARPLYLASCALGLVPVRYVRGAGGTGLRASWPAVAYAALLCVALLVSAILYLTWASLEKYGAILDTKTVLTDVLRTVLTYGSVLGAIAASALLHRRRLGPLLALVATVDRALVADRAALYRRSHRLLCAQLAAVALVLCAYAVYEGVGDSADFDQEADWFFHYTLTVYPLVFSAVVDCQFVLAAQMLHARFSRVNAYFEALLRECQTRNRSSDVFLELSFQERRKNVRAGQREAEVEGAAGSTAPVLLDDLLVQRVFGEVFRDNAPSSVPAERAGGELSQPPGLNTLFRSHDALCDAVDRVNVCFGFQVLLELTCLFVDTICSVYYSVRIGMHRYVHWLMLDVMKIVALATFGHRCTAAAYSTAPLISRLLLEPTSPRARRLLARFSQQLLHARARLCACGLLAVDGGLLAQMAGAIATYIVILMQYKAVGLPGDGDAVNSTTAAALVPSIAFETTSTTTTAAPPQPLPNV